MGDLTSIKSSSKNSERIDRKLRDTSKTLNWEELKFPVNLSDINKFENHNSSISVNVFVYEKLIYPLKISEHNYKRESTFNLLLISDDTKQHYCWIKDISKLLFLQTSKHGHVRHVCCRFLNTFNSEKSLASHHEYSISHEAIQIELPEEGSILKITIGQCESHLSYMLILNPLYHSCQYANQTLTTATPSSIRNTSPVDFVTT